MTEFFKVNQTLEQASRPLDKRLLVTFHGVWRRYQILQSTYRIVKYTTYKFIHSECQVERRGG